MTEEKGMRKAAIIERRIRDSLQYLQKARDFDTCGQDDESREHVSLAISKLSFLLEWMAHSKAKEIS